MKNKEEGFTLVELMGAIVIGAIIIAGVIALINATRSSAKVSTAHDEITQIASAGQALYQYVRNDYTGITAAVVANSANIPDTLKTPKPPAKATGMINTFDQPVTITPVAKKQFKITYPLGTGAQQECIDLATKLIGEFPIVAGGVGGNTVITNAATAQTACFALATITVTDE